MNDSVTFQCKIARRKVVALKLMIHLEFPRNMTLARMGALTGSSLIITVTPQWKIYSVCLLGD